MELYRSSYKKNFLEISQNSQENRIRICVRIFFLVKLHLWACKFIKKETGTGAFLWVLQNSYEHLFLQKNSGRLLLNFTLKQSSHPEVFIGNGILKICSEFTGEQPFRRVVLIKFQSNVIEIILRHGCSPVNLLHIFRKPFSKNTSERLV